MAFSCIAKRIAQFLEWQSLYVWNILLRFLPVSTYLLDHPSLMKTSYPTVIKRRVKKWEKKQSILTTGLTFWASLLVFLLQASHPSPHNSLEVLDKFIFCSLHSAYCFYDLIFYRNKYALIDINQLYTHHHKRY